jgi:cysteinyl-tRNA synthetase
VVGVWELLEKADAEALRYFYMHTHYRSPLNFEVAERDGKVVYPSVEEAEGRLAYFYETISRLDDFLGDKREVEPGPVVKEAEGLRERFVAAMDDDFNSALAIAELGEAIKLANKLLDDAKSAAKDVRRRTLARLRHEILDFGHGALGLFNQPARAWLASRRDRLVKARGLDQAWIEGKLVERAEARKNKDFARADGVRAELKERGVEVMDTVRGAEWRVV